MEPDTLPYCGGTPLPAELVSRWNFDPLVMGLLAMGFLLCRKAGARSGPLLGGFAVLTLLFVSPFCALTSALFSARTVHHVLLIALAAPLVAMAFRRESKGGPGALAAWTLAHAAILWAWHAPSAYAFALGSYVGYALMQATLLGSAIGFWRAVIASPGPAAGTALLATMMQMGLLGALLTFAGTAIYRWHWITTQAWGLSPLEDQQLAGLVMWVPGAGAYLFAALYLAGSWLRGRESGRERAIAA
ncbi:cytochrome c oxidase assembly protein [Novosphingobium sp. AP12]|uniref:cytochrome c oxidase assembly protein n=1 Tax=Novosphingobium sp. AP12 TaxID=1144305 RepID=UPI0002721E6A|nr:cytochrome c oxidase assembly protein [Novosphingobium sp. AP12]EJL35077.1 putative membrane protein [Novosphingobium sp. AP12]